MSCLPERAATATLMTLCALAIAMLGACDSRVTSYDKGEQSESEVSISIPLSKVLAAVIARAQVVITASGMDELSQDLRVDGSMLTGTVTGIPAGLDRLFTLNAYDAGGTLLYTGSSSVDIIAGTSVPVEVTLRSTSTPIDGSSLVVQGTPIVTQGTLHSFSDWSSLSFGNDARITGEITNDGSAAAYNVTVTVTLRTPAGDLLGRVRDHIVGTINEMDSELFTVFILDVFSTSVVDTTPYQVEIKIHEGSSLTIEPMVSYRKTSTTTTITVVIVNRGTADATGIEVFFRAKNSNDLAIADTTENVGTVGANDDKLFDVTFSGTDASSTGTRSVQKADYTISYNEGSDIRGSVTLQ